MAKYATIFTAYMEQIHIHKCSSGSLSLPGFISKDLGLGSGVASHYFVPADSFGLPVQVQQG